MDLEWHWKQPGVNRWGARGPDALLIVGFIVSVLGLAFLGVGIGTALWTQNFVSKSVRTQGTVVGMREVQDSQAHSTSYAPVFSFVATDGRSYSVSSGNSSNPPGFEVGQTVRVLYLPANPAGAKIESFGQLWVIPVVFGAIGGVFTLTGFTLLTVGIVLKRRGRKASLQPWAANPGVTVSPDVTWRGGRIDPE